MRRFLKALGLSFVLGVSCKPAELPSRGNNDRDFYSTYFAGTEFSAHQCSIGQYECEYIVYGLSVSTPSLEEVTPENFDEKVFGSELPATAYFYSPTCAPCMLLKPMYEKVCNEFEGKIYCAAYNVDQEEECESPISPRYEVDGVPALRFFCKGEEVESMRMDKGWTEGILRYEFQQLLEKCL